ncbi:MAG: putative Ig domain-containing protein, partial [Acidobacteria bacterium]|nr:putative Ig domain-containing protein [Acidobacteriota bacterium]
MEMLGRVVQPEKFSRWLAVSLILFAASIASGQAQFGITTKGLPDGVVGQSYSATVTASGGTIPYNWEVGTLPPGLRSAVSRDILTISGVPERAVELSVKITVTDSGRIPLTDSQPFTIIISPPPLAITTSSSLPEGTVGTAYSQTLAATGGTTPYSWSVIEGSLPPRLALDSRTGEISGTPTTAETYRFAVQVTDATDDTDSRNFAISILPPPLT